MLAFLFLSEINIRYSQKEVETFKFCLIWFIVMGRGGSVIS